MLLPRLPWDGALSLSLLVLLNVQRLCCTRVAPSLAARHTMADVLLRVRTAHVSRPNKLGRAPSHKSAGLRGQCCLARKHARMYIHAHARGPLHAIYLSIVVELDTTACARLFVRSLCRAAHRHGGGLLQRDRILVRSAVLPESPGERKLRSSLCGLLVLARLVAFRAALRPACA